MATYVKEVQALQYEREKLTLMKQFLGIKNAVIDQETGSITIPEFHNQPDGSKWLVKVGDFVEKNEFGFVVYKPERFLKEHKLKEEVKNVISPTSGVKAAAKAVSLDAGTAKSASLSIEDNSKEKVNQGETKSCDDAIVKESAKVTDNVLKNEKNASSDLEDKK